MLVNIRGAGNKQSGKNFLKITVRELGIWFRNSIFMVEICNGAWYDKMNCISLTIINNISKKGIVYYENNKKQHLEL